MTGDDSIRGNPIDIIKITNKTGGIDQCRHRAYIGVAIGIEFVPTHHKDKIVAIWIRL